MLRNTSLFVLITISSITIARRPYKKKEEVKETFQAKNQQSAKTETHNQQPSKQQTTSPQTVTVKNNIKPAMLAYKHWTGTYEPEIFTISINGQIIEQDKEYKIEANDKTLEVRYDYSFANGFRKGAKIVTFQIEKANNLNLTFSWNDEYHVIMDHTTPLEAKNVPFKPNKV